jgi:hypothetical protein
MPISTPSEVPKVLRISDVQGAMKFTQKLVVKKKTSQKLYTTLS